MDNDSERQNASKGQRCHIEAIAMAVREIVMTGTLGKALEIVWLGYASGTVICDQPEYIGRRRSAARFIPSEQATVIRYKRD